MKHILFYIFLAIIVCVHVGRAEVNIGIMPAVAQDISKRTQEAGVKSIAVMAFLTNGTKTNKLTGVLRDELLESLLDVPELNVYDRRDSKLVATETGLSFAGEKPLDKASCVMMAEVFCQPGDINGYFAYRIFRADDTRIIAAGFEPIRWTPEQQDLLKEHAELNEAPSLSYIDDGMLKKAVEKIQKQLKKSIGIAMFQDGSYQKDNIIDCRMAYSHIVAAMVKKGMLLYEREFMSQAATESSLENSVVEGGGNIGGIGYIRHTRSAGEDNQVKIQISAVPGGNLLASVNLTQVKGSVIGKFVGNDGDNDFEDVVDKILSEEQNVKLRYEYEVTISQNYVLPKDSQGRDFYGHHHICEGPGHSSGWVDLTPKNTSINAEYWMMNFAKLMARRYLADKSKIKEMVDLGSIIGFSDTDCACTHELFYIGPLTLCLLEAEKNLMFVTFRQPEKIDTGSLLFAYLSAILYGVRGEKSDKLQGSVVECAPYFDYQVSITYRNGLPHKVKCIVDFTRSKNMLVRRQKDQRN